MKERIVEDPPGRRELYERFIFAQRFAQKDPWAERASEGIDREEFRPMAEVSAA